MASKLETDMASVVTALGGIATTHKFGSRYLSEHASPPRVIWERGKASFEAPAIGTNSNPNALLVVNQQVLIHLWARTDEELESMFANEIVALRRAHCGTYSVDSFEQGAVNEEWIRLGFAGLLTCSIKYRITDGLVPVGEIEKVEQMAAEVSSAWMDSGGMLAE